MTMHNIKAVIFDLGRVLVAIDNTLLTEQLFKGLDTDDLQELGRRTMSDPAMIEFNSGRISAEVFYEKMRLRYDWKLDFDEFQKLWCRIFNPMEGMQELVTQLDRHVKLGLLSDTDPLHWNHIISAWPWIETFENPTLSYQVGIMKPNPEIYLTVAANVDSRPEQCLYIDDLDTNIEGARAVGMSAVRFESVTQIRRFLYDIRLIYNDDDHAV